MLNLKYGGGGCDVIVEYTQATCCIVGSPCHAYNEQSTMALKVFPAPLTSQADAQHRMLLRERTR